MSLRVLGWFARSECSCLGRGGLHSPTQNHSWQWLCIYPIFSNSLGLPGITHLVDGFISTAFRTEIWLDDGNQLLEMPTSSCTSRVHFHPHGVIQGLNLWLQETARNIPYELYELPTVHRRPEIIICRCCFSWPKGAKMRETPKQWGTSILCYFFRTEKLSFCQQRLTASSFLWTAPRMTFGPCSTTMAAIINQDPRNHYHNSPH